MYNYYIFHFFYICSQQTCIHVAFFRNKPEKTHNAATRILGGGGGSNTADLRHITAINSICEQFKLSTCYRDVTAGFKSGENPVRKILWQNPLEHTISNFPDHPFSSPPIRALSFSCTRRNLPSTLPPTFAPTLTSTPRSIVTLSTDNPRRDPRARNILRASLSYLDVSIFGVRLLRVVPDNKERHIYHSIIEVFFY